MIDCIECADASINNNSDSDDELGLKREKELQFAESTGLDHEDTYNLLRSRNSISTVLH